MKRSKTRRSRSKQTYKRSPCAVACTLDLLGDKWTLLVIRDLLWFDKHLYSDMLHSGECIPTNVLADRLKRLEEAGLVTKTPYQHNPVRYAYRLTPMGTALHPVLQSIAHWANEHLPYTAVLPDEILRGKPLSS